MINLASIESYICCGKSEMKLFLRYSDLINSQTYIKCRAFKYATILKDLVNLTLHNLKCI